MTPLQIINEEIQLRCDRLKYYHQSFRNARFRPTETQSEVQKQFDQDNRIRSAKLLVKNEIELVRYLRRIKKRMQFHEKFQRDMRRRKEVRR